MDTGFDLSFGGDWEQSITEGEKTESTVFDRTWDILIIGGGPAGINAAIYARRKGLDPLIVAERLGGQIMDTSEVDNYLGLPGTNGFDLAMRYIDHAKALSIEMLEGVRVDRYETATIASPEAAVTMPSSESKPAATSLLHSLFLSDGRELQGRSILIATGSKPKYLDIPGETRLYGRGVSYCAICDGFFFRGQSVVIAGGGNAAIEAAIDMAKIAAEVTVIQRSVFRADRVLLDVADSLPNVKRIDQSQILEILGEDKVEAVRILDKRSSLTYDFQTAAVFVEIGHLPNPGPFANMVERNEFGEVMIDRQFHTSLEGVYAAGDVTIEPFKQIIVAAAAGASAALVINQDLNRLTAVGQDHTMSQMPPLADKNKQIS